VVPAETTRPNHHHLGLAGCAVGSEDAMLIGDTTYDIEAAARAGGACIGVRCGG